MQGKVIIADPHPGEGALLARHLRRAGFAVAAFVTGESALAAAEAERPLLVLLEVLLPGICGHELLWRLRRLFADTVPVVYVSGQRGQPADRVAGLLLGADAYLVKPVSEAELVAHALRLTHAARAPSEGPAGLTRREREVLSCLAIGLGPREIAGRLTISQTTVSTHIQHILTKLGVHSQAQAVAHAHRHGLCDGAP
jgi:DNA-binding NarL/FixJ family response regulator